MKRGLDGPLEWFALLLVISGIGAVFRPKDESLSTNRILPCTIEQAKVGCIVRREQEKLPTLMFEYYGKLPERFRYKTSYLQGLHQKGGAVLVVSFVAPRSGERRLGGNQQIDTLLRIQGKVIGKFTPPGVKPIDQFLIMPTEDGKEEQMFTVVPVKFLPPDFDRIVPELT